jgi:Cu/Ag efflux protein CusF
MRRLTTPLAAAILAWCMVVAVAQRPQLVTGEVTRVDQSSNKITIRHGPIKNLDMTEKSMTMVFVVQDPANLTKVKPGDKIRFTAERINGVITVTRIEKR